MGRLDRKTAVVTGASRGTGRAVALELGGAGLAVAVNYATRRAEAEAVVAAIAERGGVAWAVQADVSDRSAVEGMFRAVDERFGRLAVLVNNARSRTPSGDARSGAPGRARAGLEYLRDLVGEVEAAGKLRAWAVRHGSHQRRPASV
jgi:NAD(P)-dependent dehydrogenase (short-subunit alcohol dehydrogenase family)